jgi:hypothetical protein
MLLHGPLWPGRQAGYLWVMQCITECRRPPETLDGAAVQAMLSSGEAVALLPDNPWSPIRYRDRWYGMPDGMSDELFQPVDEKRQAELDLMLSRLSPVSTPRSDSALAACTRVGTLLSFALQASPDRLPMHPISAVQPNLRFARPCVAARRSVETIMGEGEGEGAKEALPALCR